MTIWWRFVPPVHHPGAMPNILEPTARRHTSAAAQLLPLCRYDQTRRNDSRCLNSLASSAL